MEEADEGPLFVTNENDLWNNIVDAYVVGREEVVEFANTMQMMQHDRVYDHISFLKHDLSQMVLVCSCCADNEIDATVKPFVCWKYDHDDYDYWVDRCPICGTGICSDCGKTACRKCNDLVAREIGPCQYGCKRLCKDMAVFCPSCWAQFFEHQERIFLPCLKEAVLSYLGICGEVMPEEYLKRVAYYGNENLKLFFVYKDYFRVLVCRFRYLFVIYEVQYFFENKERILTTFAGFLSTYDVPKLRPWKAMKVIARLVIIVNRYKKDFYHPESGRYVNVVGPSHFAKRRKLLNCKKELQSRNR